MITELFDKISIKYNIPSYDDILIIQQESITFKNRPEFSYEDLIPVNEYGETFNILFNSGIEWINIAFYGIFENNMIIGIEHSLNKRGDNTKINFQGPPLDIKTNELLWDLNMNFYIKKI